MLFVRVMGGAVWILEDHFEYTFQSLGLRLPWWCPSDGDVTGGGGVCSWRTGEQKRR